MTKSFSWNELDERAVAFGKALAADAVEKVGSGHPGAAISLTAAAYLLYQKEMRVDPACPTWLGRDRFILSAGHASVMQYVQLVLAGYGLEVSDLEQLRRRGSRTPAHPEYGHTPGVEATTGPLGSGFAAAVGMAAAARREHGLYDAATPAGESIFDHNIYGFWGIFIVQTMSFFPVCYMMLKGLLKNIDPSLEEAARDMGASRWKVFTSVTLPLILPGLAQRRQRRRLLRGRKSPARGPRSCSRRNQASFTNPPEHHHCLAMPHQAG